MNSRSLRTRAVALCVGLAITSADGLAGTPLADSRCPGSALVDPAFRDAALDLLESLVVHAPGKSADGAIRIDHGAGLLDAERRPWFRVSAYQVNLGMTGALASAGPRMLPIAADWLRWQARHIAPSGAARGVVLDTWVRADTNDESTCPDRAAGATCDDVDAYDSTAASTLLMADAFMRGGGDVAVLRDPAMRRALEAAATALTTLADEHGFTIAKPAHPVVYLMDQVEVAAGWRAWSRLQTEVYAQPASGINSAVLAATLESGIRSRFAGRDGWHLAAQPTALQPRRWYPDTVAQAWPLLWLPENRAEPDHARAIWKRAIVAWQRETGASWSKVTADPDGFWWPAIAVAAHCVGDSGEATRWVARARSALFARDQPFARSFQVGDLLWLLWMAEPAIDARPPAA